MKILHLVAGEINGGAARGAYWLHSGLCSLGVESRILTNSSSKNDDNNVISIADSFCGRFLKSLRNLPDRLLPALYSKYSYKIFSTSLLGYNFTEHCLYEWADIIHLHWINAGFVNIKHLYKITKPIVWTMRDMWPMTGGCHYAMECEKYKTGCGKCPQLGSQNEYDLSRFVLARKKKYLPRAVAMVGISNWLSERAKESQLLQNFSVTTISNNIDTNDFFPTEKLLAREALGIETEKLIILTGSTNSKDYYKGFDKFLEALKGLDKSKLLVCFFGNVDESVTNNLGFECKSFGYLNDAISLRLLYSCANVFVAPSIMEAFGKTLVEAMACGTPVVCFDATGPRDVVDHQKNGYKAKPYEPDDLANGIKWVLNSRNYDELCSNARNKAVEKFDSKVVAQQYIALYRKLLQSGTDK